MKRLTIILILLFAVVSFGGCSPAAWSIGTTAASGIVILTQDPLGVQKATPETLKGGYSCEWKCIITTDRKWSGSFGSVEGSRTLQGKGNAEVCLPDGPGVKSVMVQKYEKKGIITVQIIGPDYEGQTMITNSAYGVISLSTQPDSAITETQTKQMLEQMLK